MQNILVIDGNPSRERKSLSSALADSYASGAMKSGYKVKQVSLASLSFDPILHEGYYEDQILEPDLQMLRNSMVQADHWVLVFPIWLALPPALVKGFMERTLTRGFAFDYSGKFPVALPVLKGKSVRIILTCGMPSWMYRWFSGAYTTKALRSTIKLCGMRLAGVTVLGSVHEQTVEAKHRYSGYVEVVHRLGEAKK